MNKVLLTISWIITCIVFISPSVKGQGTIGTILSNIKSKVTEVQVDKITYKQSFEVIDEAKGKVNFTSLEVNEKGAVSKSEFIFYISDVDKNTIIRKPSGKKLFVSMSINNKQKFVKFSKDDKLDSYVDNVEILVPDADAAQSIMDNIKAAIPLVKSNEKSWSNANDALNWLKNNIKEVDIKTGKVVQAFNFGNPKSYLVSLNTKSTDTKGVTIDENYDFNILDINKNNISVKVTGAFLSVKIEIISGNKYVKYSKNNQLQNNASDLEILAEDVDQARGIISALLGAIEKSKSQMPELSNITQAAELIQSKTTDVNIDTKAFKQKIEINSGSGSKAILKIEEADSKGKTITSNYEFYLADIEPASINLKVTGKKVLLVFNTINKVKLIKYTKENVLQNFVNDIELVYTDIETVRELILAFKKANNDSKWQARDWKSVADAMKFLEDNIKGGTVLNNKYVLSFDGDYTDPFKCTYNVNTTDEKGLTTEIGYLFYPQTLNPATVHIESSGKYLSVISGVNGKKTYVKKLTKDDKNSFGSELEIIAFDSKEANDVADALKYILLNAKPNEKTWATQQEAIAFVKENIGDLGRTGKEVKQKLELVDNDPCKLIFTTTTTDDKGKTLEEIYEFNLADMNKLAVDFKTSTGNVYISLICKNKQKLIKVYKNGAQQAYASDMEIVDDDIDTGKNIVEAFKAAIVKCEK